MPVTILNNVIGPVMPGSSSAHTAGAYYIAKLFLDFLGDSPSHVRFIFAPGSSIAGCYKAQGTDLALIMGILGLPLTDRRFREAALLPRQFGVDVEFVIEEFPEAAHPNSIKIEAESKGVVLSAIADSIGGGAFIMRWLDGCRVDISGESYYIFVRTSSELKPDIFNKKGKLLQFEGGYMLSSSFELTDGFIDSIRMQRGVLSVRTADPIFYPTSGQELFTNGTEMIAYAVQHSVTLGEAALLYEATLLNMPEEKLNEEMDRRLSVMEDSVALGLSLDSPPMFMLQPTAKKIMEAEASGKLAMGGLHTRVAARALAAMQVNSGQGIICAAPTGGSAGVLASIVVTMLEDMKLPRCTVLRALWAAGAIGWILGVRGTFTSSVGACQVEIGAAGAMAAAAIVEAACGNAEQCCDAAAIMFHNAMGLVCDPVQNIVEIPCHTRNASFASAAFICADMILGGYKNPIGIDCTIDAVMATARMLPCELRSTSRGGIATTCDALSIKKLR